MADTTTPIADAWAGFAKASIVPGTPAWQIDSMRSIFFAGAMAAATLINETNGSGGDVDLLFDHIEAEMDGWEAELKQQAALAACAPHGKA